MRGCRLGTKPLGWPRKKLIAVRDNSRHHCDRRFSSDRLHGSIPMAKGAHWCSLALVAGKACVPRMGAGLAIDPCDAWNAGWAPSANTSAVPEISPVGGIHETSRFSQDGRSRSSFRHGCEAGGRSIHAGGQVEDTIRRASFATCNVRDSTCMNLHETGS